MLYQQLITILREDRKGIEIRLLYVKSYSELQITYKIKRQIPTTYAESVTMKYNFVQKNIIKREKHFFFLLAIYAFIITFVISIISKHFPIKPIHYPIKERLKFFISGNNFAENLFFSGHTDILMQGYQDLRFWWVQCVTNLVKLTLFFSVKSFSWAIVCWFSDVKPQLFT